MATGKGEVGVERGKAREGTMAVLKTSARGSQNHCSNQSFTICHLDWSFHARSAPGFSYFSATLMLQSVR